MTHILRYMSYLLILAPIVTFTVHYYHDKQQVKSCRAKSAVMLENIEQSDKCKKLLSIKYEKRDWPRIVITELLLIAGMFSLLILKKIEKSNKSK